MKKKELIWIQTDNGVDICAILLSFKRTGKALDPKEVTALCHSINNQQRLKDEAENIKQFSHQCRMHVTWDDNIIEMGIFRTPNATCETTALQSIKLA